MSPTAEKRGKKPENKKAKAQSIPGEPAQNPLDLYLKSVFDNFRDGKFGDLNPTEIMLCRKIEEAEKAQVAHGEALAKLQQDINNLQSQFATRQNLRDRAQSTAQAHIDTLRSLFEMQKQAGSNVVPLDTAAPEAADEGDEEAE